MEDTKGWQVRYSLVGQIFTAMYLFCVLPYCLHFLHRNRTFWDEGAYEMQWAGMLSFIKRVKFEGEDTDSRLYSEASL